ITCVATTSPTRLPAAAPASTAARTAATSPLTIAVTSPASIFSQPTSRTFAAFTIASAASIIATRPRHSIIPSASGMPQILATKRHKRHEKIQGKPFCAFCAFLWLVSQRVDRCGYSAATADEASRRKRADRHDRRTPEQSTKFDHLANIATRHRNDPHRGRLVIHHSHRHFVGDDRGDSFRGCRAGNGHHVDTDRTHAGPCFEFGEGQRSQLRGFDHSRIFRNRNERSTHTTDRTTRHRTALLHGVSQKRECSSRSVCSRTFESHRFDDVGDRVTRNRRRREGKIDDAERNTETTRSFTTNQFACARELEREFLDRLCEILQRKIYIRVFHCVINHARAGHADVNHGFSFTHTMKSA